MSLAVEEHLALDARVRDDVVHPVQAAEERRLAAARGPDEGRHGLFRDLGSRCRGAPGSNRRRSSGSSSPSGRRRELRRRRALRLPARAPARRTGGGCARTSVTTVSVMCGASFPGAVTTRARTEKTKMTATRTSAPPTPAGASPRTERSRTCRPARSETRSADRERVEKKRLLKAVKSSGAVSPAMRARATRMPVMMPGSAAGSMTEKAARARVAPRASAPSRRVAGHEVQELLGRARDDRDHHEAERQAARRAPKCFTGRTASP